MKKSFNQLITENIKRILSEAKVEVLRKYHPNIDDTTFNWLINTDPTYNPNNPIKAGKYTKWILDQYEKDNSITNRLRQLSDDLKEFNPNLQQDRATIDKIQTTEELHARVKSLYGKKEVSKQETFNQDIVYDKNGWMVVTPSSFESSRYWGQNTHWCTASENDYYYNRYLSEGPLYIVINKQTQDKWQFHKPSDQYMDIDDDEVNPYDIGMPDELIDWLTGHDAIELTPAMDVIKNGVTITKFEYNDSCKCYDFYVEGNGSEWGGDWFYLQIRDGEYEIDQSSVYEIGLDGDTQGNALNIINDAVLQFAEDHGLIGYDDENDGYYLITPNREEEE